MVKNVLTIERASFSAILLKSPSLTKRHLWGFLSRQIQIRHDNRDGTSFGTLSSIPAQLSFFPNRTNAIKWAKKKTPSTIKPSILYCYMQFFNVLYASAHLNVLYRKSWLTILLYESWNMFQTFLLANFLSGKRVGSFNSLTMSLGAHRTILIDPTKSQPTDFYAHCTTF